jgi:hypothetical protein
VGSGDGGGVGYRREREINDERCSNFWGGMVRVGGQDVREGE